MKQFVLERFHGDIYKLELRWWIMSLVMKRENLFVD
jgi:hypothetical protein